MEHVVFFTGENGAPGTMRMPSLEEALRFVEHLRNAEGVSDIAVYALTPVPLVFKTVVRVEVDGPVAVPAPNGVPEVATLEDLPEPAEPREPATTRGKGFFGG